MLSRDVSTPKLFIAFPVLEVATFRAGSEEGNACPPLDCSSPMALAWGEKLLTAGQSRQPSTGIHAAVARDQNWSRVLTRLRPTPESSPSETVSIIPMFTVSFMPISNKLEKLSRLKSYSICSSLLWN